MVYMITHTSDGTTKSKVAVISFDITYLSAFLNAAFNCANMLTVFVAA